MHGGSRVAARQERGCCLPHLLRAPGVGDNALTGLLNIQTHLEPTSQSQRQHHQPHRRWLPSRCPTAESKPQTPQASEELRVQDTVYCYENFEKEGRSHPGARREARGHWVQSEALGRSLPKGTASQALPYKCGWTVCLSGQQLREQEEKAGTLCQEPSASGWTLPVFPLASDKELQSQEKWPQGPLASNSHPN